MTLALLLLAGAPVLPASAAESRSQAVQDGWWNRLQGPVDGEPGGNPVRPLVPAVPKQPNVPADAIAVGVTGGQVDKVAAVGIDILLEDGATLDGLTLRLEESATSGANLSADEVKVIACPATAAWGPGHNAAWRDRPTADCELGAAEGARGDDGTWTFDLGAIGRLWVDPVAPLPAFGVVLSIDPASAPAGAQVSWVNLDAGGVAVEVAVTPARPGPAGETASGLSEPAATAAPAPVPTAPFAQTSAGPLAPDFTAVTPDPLASGAGQSGFTDATPPAAAASHSGAVPETPAETALAAPAAAGPEAVPSTRPGVGFWERVPAPTALLVPVAVGLAILVGVVLGPGGRPAPVLQREGGLSRALARRSAAGGDAA